MTINGFKSFGDRATLHFAPGVTAIVGPNGSGKSNVIDALRWATGGGRASEFRAGEKTDLIFHGADGKKSQSFAEVEIELGSGAKRIHISRNLYRDGQSKLRLGGKNARFLDLEEELAGSGLGRSGLALIGQGEVSQVLMADPAKLLGYVAEAAGVGKFAARREQTQARLATARDHLERLEDVILELDRRLESLAKEASEADRAAGLGRDILQLRYSLCQRRVSGLESEIMAMNKEKAGLQQAVEAGRTELADARQRWQRAREDLVALEEDYRLALAQAEARRGDLRVAQERMHNLRTRRQALLEEDGRVRSDIARLEAVERPVAPAGDEDALREALTEATRQRDEAHQELTGTEGELQSLASRLDVARQELSRAREGLRDYQRRKSELEQGLDGIRARLRELEQDTDQDLGSREAHLGKLREELEAKGQQAESLREKLAELQQRHAHAVADRQATERNAARARSALETRRGYAQGPRQVLTSGIDGVIGSVADLIRVPTELQVALSSALGRRAENIVVADAAVAQKVLAYLKRSGGWATLLPLDLVEARAPRLDPLLAQAPGVVGLASDLIEFEPRYSGVVFQLLGGTLLVETMEQAVALARRFRQRPRLVTLDGDLLESHGAMSGGRRQVNTGLLGLAAEVEDAEEEAARAAALAERLTGELQASQENFRELQATARNIAEELRRLESVLGRQRESEAGRRTLAEELASQLADMETRLAGLVEPVVPEDAELVGLEAVYLEVQERVQSLRQRAEGLSASQADARQQLALHRERWSAFQAALQRFEEEQSRLVSLRARGQQLDDAVAAATRDETAAQGAVSEAQAALPRDLEAKKAAHAEATRLNAQSEDTLAALTQAQADRGRALEELQVTLARREAALELAQEEASGFPPGLECREGSSKALRDALSEAERELDAIGPVNHRARQDYEAGRARLDDLRSQAADATSAAEELQGVLADIDRETDSRLGAAIDRLRRSFGRHAAELFGENAQAGIEVQIEDSRPVGLAIGLQPPGKRTRSLNLLSVGERTMGALAFLFALMSEGEGQRLPIAILDEVDAPLDEANIRRFRDFLQRLAAHGTQFVLITHQKATMEVADALWGVTTERGVSRLFSIQRPADAPAA